MTIDLKSPPLVASLSLGNTGVKGAEPPCREAGREAPPSRRRGRYGRSPLTGVKGAEPPYAEGGRREAPDPRRVGLSMVAATRPLGRGARTVDKAHAPQLVYFWTRP